MSISMQYTKEYFIEKFEAIDAEFWDIGNYVNPANKDCKCALGHCGQTFLDTTPESVALGKLLDFNVANINDGINDASKKYGLTPKERILNALKSLP